MVNENTPQQTEKSVIARDIKATIVAKSQKRKLSVYLLCAIASCCICAVIIVSGIVEFIKYNDRLKVLKDTISNTNKNLQFIDETLEQVKLKENV